MQALQIDAVAKYAAIIQTFNSKSAMYLYRSKLTDSELTSFEVARILTTAPYKNK